MLADYDTVQTVSRPVAEEEESPGPEPELALLDWHYRGLSELLNLENLTLVFVYLLG